MAETRDPRDELNLTGDVPEEPSGYESEESESGSPRRAASAQFIVESQPGSQAALREAMDPANQSLAEALRLSFRVLQIVILVLIVLFIISGIETVKEGQTGVMTRFGKIMPVRGDEALQPGPVISFWPFPAGDFVLFDEQRTIDLGNAFWPRVLPQETFEQAVERSSVNDQLMPARDGSLISREGDLAHLRMSATYLIEQPQEFVKRLKLSDADATVRLALQRATIARCATLSLQQIVDMNDEVRDSIRTEAQSVLDKLQCGIRITDVIVPQATPPLPIVKSFGEVQTARVSAEENIERAREEAGSILVRTISSDRPPQEGEAPIHVRVSRLISEYEDASELNDQAAADAKLAQLHAEFEDPATGGDVSKVVSKARSFRIEIQGTLGSELARFENLLPAFRASPKQVITQLWMDAYAEVLSRDDIETFYVQDSSSPISLKIVGHDEVAERRRDKELDMKERGTQTGLEAIDFMLQGKDYLLPGQGPGRRLKVTPEGEVVSPRSNPAPSSTPQR